MSGAEIAAAMMAASSAMGAVSSIASGRQAAGALEANADAARTQGVLQQRQAAAKAEQLAREDRRLQSAQVAAAAGAGIDPFAGSPLSVIAADAGRAAADYATLIEEGTLAREMGQTQRSMLRTEAKNVRTASYFNAASQLVGGGAQAYGAYRQGNLQQMQEDDLLARQSPYTGETTSSYGGRGRSRR